MKLNNFILVFIFLILGIFILGFVNAAESPCWRRIDCSNNPIPSGSIINSDYINNSTKEEMCEISGINIETYRNFEIEIIQGQFEGGVKSIRIFVDEPFVATYDKVYFLLSKATSPTYVLCHENVNSTGATENPVRLGTRDFWTASYDQQWFKQNAGMAEYDGYETLKNWNENNTYNNSDKNSLHTTNEETTTQKTNNDNRLYNILGIIVISFLIIFSYNILYLKGYKIFTLGVWLGFAFLSFIYLKNASTILAWSLAIMVFYLFIIWFKENASRVIKGGFDKI